MSVPKRGLLSFFKNNSVRSIVIGAAVLGADLSVSGQEGSSEEKTIQEQPSDYRWEDLCRKKFQMDRATETLARYALRKYETNVDHFYFDTKGKLTTGIGLNVDDWGGFSKLDLVDAKGNKLNAEQKKAAYEKTRTKKNKQAKLGFNYVASYYKDAFDFKATSESLENLFIERFNGACGTARNEFGFHLYNIHPYGAAMLYCNYFSMGEGKFNEKNWPNFFDAMYQLNYNRAAEESHVKDWSDERNNYVKGEFLKIPKNFNETHHLGTDMENAFIDCSLGACPNYSNTIRCGSWDKKVCAVVGPGIPVTLDDVKNLNIADYCGAINANTLYQDVIKNKKTFELPDSVVRQCAKNYFNKNREKQYVNLCKKYGIVFENLPPEVRIAVFTMDIATGGRVKTYQNFWAAVAKENWLEAANQCNVSDKLFMANVKGAQEGDSKLFNNYTQSIFFDLNKKKVAQNMPDLKDVATMKLADSR
ncbi:MAG: hypothetical protein J6P93_03035 [Alphaproteobacteria bacterium]|nr:hypothetical protein [Alphaproteobacteria bacterium]